MIFKGIISFEVMLSNNEVLDSFFYRRNFKCEMQQKELNLAEGLAWIQIFVWGITALN